MLETLFALGILAASTGGYFYFSKVGPEEDFVYRLRDMSGTCQTWRHVYVLEKRALGKWVEVKRYNTDGFKKHKLQEAATDLKRLTQRPDGVLFNTEVDDVIDIDEILKGVV